MQGCGFDADLSKVDPKDRREIRNFQRFLLLWPIHGFDMMHRPRWRKYLGLTDAEAEAMLKRSADIANNGP